LDFTMTETCPDVLTFSPTFVPTFSPTFYPTFGPTFYPTFDPIDFPSTLLFPTPQLKHRQLEVIFLEELRMGEEVQMRFMKWWSTLMDMNVGGILILILYLDLLIKGFHTFLC